VKYLLDTDHISILQQRFGTEYATLAARIAMHPRTDLALSIVSFHEQVLGSHSYIARATAAAGVVRGYGMLSRLLSDYAAVSVLAFDTSAALVFDGLVGQRIRIGSMDLRIASVALTNRLTLLTRNVTDFRRVPGLTTEDWTA
jgi:tRNA(fMet)-specific endonuclease VapC